MVSRNPEFALPATRYSLLNALQLAVIQFDRSALSCEIDRDQKADLVFTAYYDAFKAGKDARTHADFISFLQARFGRQRTAKLNKSLDAS